MEDMNEKYREKNPFTVPDGYFDGLTERIMDLTENKKDVRKPRLWQVLRPYIGVAAMFVVIMGVMHIVVPMTMESNRTSLNETVAHGAWDETLLEDDIFDSEFNPTSDEIIEYLATEIDDYELILANVY